MYFLLLDQNYEIVNMLKDPGPTKYCWWHYEHILIDDHGTTIWTTPPYLQNTLECESGYEYPTFQIITLNYTQDSFKQYPGWDLGVDVDDDGNIAFLSMNHARYMNEDICTLHEITALHFHNYGEEHASFFDSYKFSDFDEVWFTFQAKLNGTPIEPACATFPTSCITADFGVQFPNGYYYILGVLIYNNGITIGNVNGYDLNENTEDDIYWKSSDPYSPHQVLLHGEKLAYPYLTTDEYTYYAINYKHLMAECSYIHPLPDGYTWDDATIIFAEVYSTVRGADLDFWAKNGNVYGVKYINN